MLKAKEVQSAIRSNLNRSHSIKEMPMTVVTALAERICALGYDRLPDAAVEWAKVGILDTVGVTLAGSVEPCARIVRRVAAAPGPALVFGTSARLAVADAALVNGTASHALDFDDCSNTLGGHPSVPVLPALFALADTRAVTGRDFIAAYVAGFETETRIARAVNFHHYDKGWHPTATLGVFGAAAAASHLLGLSIGETATRPRLRRLTALTGLGTQPSFATKNSTARRG
jgi:2-methylcitrate dehydratase PrpD